MKTFVIHIKNLLAAEIALNNAKKLILKYIEIEPDILFYFQIVQAEVEFYQAIIYEHKLDFTSARIKYNKSNELLSEINGYTVLFKRIRSQSNH